MNDAISQTFTRSINTSLTTFIMVLVLFVMGVSSIRDFTMPLMVGIVSGCWSSVTIAGPLWYDLSMYAAKKKAAKKAAEKAAKAEKKSQKLKKGQQV